MENLIAKKLQVVPSHNVHTTTVIGEKVGVRLADLHRAGWSYAAKARTFADNLISKDLMRCASRSLVENNIDQLISNPDLRKKHLNKICHSSKYETELKSFARCVEVFGEGAYFLRAIEDVWEGGNKILRSIETRIYDMTPADVHALGVFVAFHDVLTLSYYDSTARSSCVDSNGRAEVQKHIERFYDIRKLFRKHRYELVVRGIIVVAEKLRDTKIEIARKEATKVMKVNSLSRTWEESLAGRLSVVMISRSSTDSNEETFEFAKRTVDDTFGLSQLSNLIVHLETLDKVPDAFAKAETQYIESFTK